MVSRTLSDFATDRRGAILPMAAMTMGVLLAVGALALDGSHGFMLRDQLQATADAAALAGASQLPSATAAAVKTNTEYQPRSGAIAAETCGWASSSARRRG